MKILKKCVCILLGSILALSLIPYPNAQALSGAKELTAVYGGLTLLIDGTQILLYDAHGKSDAMFNVDGVIYAPIFSIADALGVQIHFSAETMTMSTDKDILSMITILQQTPVAFHANMLGSVGPKTKTLDARFGNLKWVIQGKQILFYDIYGNVSEPFGVDGTIYAPVGTAYNNTFMPKTETTMPASSAAIPASSIGQKLKKGMTDEEFAQAYAEALKIAQKYAGMSREEQLKGIFRDIRSITDTKIRYTTSEKHYNDVYGFFILNIASCAGATRAVGLCLNILNIPFEHVNENKWLHQWCRVRMENGAYWICDPFGLCNGYETIPYEHPYFGKG